MTSTSSLCIHHDPEMPGWMICKHRGFAMTLKEAAIYCPTCPSKADEA